MKIGDLYVITNPSRIGEKLGVYTSVNEYGVRGYSSKKLKDNFVCIGDIILLTEFLFETKYNCTNYKIYNSILLRTNEKFSHSDLIVKKLTSN